MARDATTQNLLVGLPIDDPENPGDVEYDERQVAIGWLLAQTAAERLGIKKISLLYNTKLELKQDRSVIAVLGQSAVNSLVANAGTARVEGFDLQLFTNSSRNCVPRGVVLAIHPSKNVLSMVDDPLSGPLAAVILVPWFEKDLPAWIAPWGAKQILDSKTSRDIPAT